LASTDKPMYLPQVAPLVGRSASVSLHILIASDKPHVDQLSVATPAQPQAWDADRRAEAVRALGAHKQKENRLDVKKRSALAWIEGSWFLMRGLETPTSPSGYIKTRCIIKSMTRRAS
jgi:hypothetical protein